MDVSQTQPAEMRDRRSDALGDLRVLSDELLCGILGYLSFLDVGRIACVSSVMYILCTEEPLWMSLCLNNVKGQLQFKGSWKKTTLSQEHLAESEELCQIFLQFNGFNSLFLYRRFYRCYTTLSSFSFDSGNVERKCDLSLEEFNHEFDGKKPVLVSGLADTWPARNTWTIDHLLSMYGGATFNISQRSFKKITMKFSDYVSYMKLQHDEDPLYIFDEKFGESTPGLLNDYDVPNIFHEDLFNVLDVDQRPSFRWLIIGPERSGASWHVDPALTSAWNTLLCGRKRWALYPPGRVPLGVTVHVNEQDGDVNIETPSSLQWWLDFYPLLADEDKPIEFTQLPGETIYVPSGWWHTVLNLETTIAVTQNYVNKNNFEFVCLDMAPGYHHKGVCRAGLLAIDNEIFEKVRVNYFTEENSLSYSDFRRKEKRIKVSSTGEDYCIKNGINAALSYYLQNQEYCYSIDFLSLFLDDERDHYNSMWSSGNYIGQREMREWLFRLWAKKPHMRDIIWKGACLALNANKWLELASRLCSFHNLPRPSDDERLPVATGSNPVYLIADFVVKIYVEGGLEASLHGLGTELEFYSALFKGNSPLKDHIPDVLAAGFISLQNGSFNIESWDGRGVPQLIAQSGLTIPKIFKEDDFCSWVWRKKYCDYINAEFSDLNTISPDAPAKIWPFIIIRRCEGKIFAQIRETISWEDALSLASFLGEQLRYLHLLPYSALNDMKLKSLIQISDTTMSSVIDETVTISEEWKIFFGTLNKKKRFISRQLTKWGEPIPRNLIEKVHEYLPDDFIKLLNISKDENGVYEVSLPCSWIHSDIMDDNVMMKDFGGHNSWRPSHILDFSDMSIGDPICDIIPIHVDIFRGEKKLLKHLLQSYKLPLLRGVASQSMEGGSKFGRLSYHAMCYCIVHDDNVLGTIFSLWKGLRLAKSWEEVEQEVWGELNNYKGDGNYV